MADKETRTPPNQAEGSEPAAPNAEINALLRAAFGTGQNVGAGTAEGAEGSGADMNARLRAAYGRS